MPSDPSRALALQVHGARGSYPIFDERCRRYGGNTSCYSFETGHGLFIIDAGTGLTKLGESLRHRTTLPPMTLLLTHVHLDHVMGLPSFYPLLRKDAAMTVLLEPSRAPEWRQTVLSVVAPPLWPVELLQLGAAVRFQEMAEGPTVCDGVTIRRCRVSHPQGGMSYRLETPAKTIVLATDHEYGDPETDQRLAEFSRGADVLLHDAQYTPEEYAARRGWGHSTWEHSARLAQEAEARQLVLVSHDPSRSDAEVDRLVGLARQVFPSTVAAAEGMTV